MHVIDQTASYLCVFSDQNFSCLHMCIFGIHFTTVCKHLSDYVFDEINFGAFSLKCISVRFRSVRFRSVTFRGDHFAGCGQVPVVGAGQRNTGGAFSPTAPATGRYGRAATAVKSGYGRWGSGPGPAG